MNVGHAHSHRPRRRVSRILTDAAIKDHLRRLERYRARQAAGPVEVVVQVPGAGRGVAGQTKGRIVGGEHHSPELRAAFERLAEERAKEAASRG